jgi:hypothetical protein
MYNKLVNKFCKVRKMKTFIPKTYEAIPDYL